MYSDSDSTNGLPATDRAERERPRGNLGTWLIGKLISKIVMGRITVVTPAGARLTHRAAMAGPEATVVLHRWRAVRRLATAGDIGFAESYIDGDWSSPDLAALIELAALNHAHIEANIASLAPVRAWQRLRHGLRLNSKTGSRRNIAFHYDLGNEFYRHWLDASMSYSSGIYQAPEQRLEQAQDAKIARILSLLDLGAGDRVLEIGCGWGALAAAIARKGAHVTGLTLSREQLAFAQDLVARERLAERTELRFEDYRDAQGRYDRIVSIEMLEAVGERYWPVYFRTLRERLQQGGTAVLQVITIAEDRLDGYRRNSDFIQRHVFPGGMLPTKAIIAEQAANAGLTLAATETFGDSYARTLRDWRQRFHDAWPEIERLGFDARFRRLWDYYLCYCEGGFRAGAIDVGLYTLRG